jgi:hypothetical protein
MKSSLQNACPLILSSSVVVEKTSNSNLNNNAIRSKNCIVISNQKRSEHQIVSVSYFIGGLFPLKHPIIQQLINIYRPLDDFHQGL